MQPTESTLVTAPLNPFARPIRGSMLGLAIGDAFGYPLEFSTQTPSAPRRQTLELRRVYYDVPSWMGGVQLAEPKAGALFSDDTQMAICVAEALCRMPLATPERTAPEVTMEFLAWASSAENTRAPGTTIMGSLGRMKSASDWTKTKNDSKGCGTIMRSQPYGWIYGPDRARWTAELHSTITHGHEAATVSAGLYAEMISRIIRYPMVSIETIVRYVAGLGSMAERGDTAPKLRKVLEMVGQALDLGTQAVMPALDLITDRYRGWTADDALAAAVGIVLLVPDPHQAIIHAGNTPGDSDSIACVVGGIVGCRAEWRHDWVEQVEKTKYLQALASRCARRVVD